MKRSVCSLKFLILPMALSAVAAPAFAGDPHEHEGDFIVGRTGANQLALEFDDDEPFVLPSVAFIPGDGWGSDDPGFNALSEDEPDEDFFQLSGSAQIAVQLVSKDPDLHVLDDVLFTALMVNPGDQWALPAGASFDDHPFWFIDDADFSEVGVLFDFSFTLVDLSGTYSESEVYTAQFTPVPEAMSGILLVCGSLVILRRNPRTRLHEPRRSA